MRPTAVDPKATSRAAAFELWMDAPNPMVTFFKTLDVTPLVRLSWKKGLKFNMLLCWCIGRAASQVSEFYLLPVGRELLRYDSIAVNTIAKNKLGEVSSCDVPFSESLAQFSGDYLRLTRKVAESCEYHLRHRGHRHRRCGGHEQRHLQQPLSHLGQIPQGSFPDDAAAVVPVPPHPDGRRTRGTVFTAFTGKHLCGKMKCTHLTEQERETICRRF